MWLFHPLGFASVVADEANPGNLMARSRFSADLRRLFPDSGPPLKTPQADYLYRLSVSRAVVAERLAELALGIDYPNFKNACPPDRQRPYHAVWQTMYAEQARQQVPATPKPRKRRSRRRSTELDEYDDLYRYPSAVRDAI
jgi:hypothetical protein